MKQLFQNVDILVVVGSWNKYIFSEDWIRNNILEEGAKCSIQYPLNALGSLKFSLENLSFFIFGESLRFQVNNDADVSYLEVIRIARKIFQKLVHTPVVALGVNYIYEADKSIDIAKDLPRNEKLLDVVGDEIISSESTRTFKISEQEILNFKVQQKDGINSFNFNFNYDIKSLNDAINIIGDEDSLILDKKKKTNSILTDIYTDHGI